MSEFLSKEDTEILESLVGKRVAVLEHRGFQTANAVYKGIIDGQHKFVGVPGTWSPNLNDFEMSRCKIVIITDQESVKLWGGFGSRDEKKWAFEGKNS